MQIYVLFIDCVYSSNLKLKETDTMKVHRKLTIVSQYNIKKVLNLFIQFQDTLVSVFFRENRINEIN